MNLEKRNRISQEIIDTCLKMESLSLNQGTSGNISHRFEDGLLITPSGIPYDKMQQKDIVFINSDGKAETHRLPSSEWRFHFDILQTKKNYNAVVHNHAPYSTMVSILNIDFIPAIHYMIAIVGGNTIPCAEYATYGTQKLSDNILKIMENRKACILKNHGLVATAETLTKSLAIAQEVELIARLYMGVIQTGDYTILSEKEINLVIEKFKNYGLNVKL